MDETSLDINQIE